MGSPEEVYLHTLLVLDLPFMYSRGGGNFTYYGHDD